MKNLKFIITFLLLLVLGVGESWGQNVTVILQVKAVLDGEILEEGDPRNPDLKITNLSTGDIYTQCPLTVENVKDVEKVTITVKFPYTFEVLSRSDYSFQGWATSKTSTQKNLNNPYSVSVNSNMTAKTTKTYYVFLHSEEAVEPTGTDGVEFTGSTGTSYLSGSSSTDWKVTLSYAENLTYDSSTPRSGANQDAKNWITITNKATNAAASYTGIYTVSSGKAYMEFPYTIPAGTYKVHLPYGLFTTVSGKPTAACDFEIDVIGDDAPFELTLITPNNNDSWSALHTDDEGETSIVAFSIDLTFNKIINRINLANKNLGLHHQETGKIFPCNGTSINYLNKSVGTLAYGVIPNGHYTITIPEGLFLDTNGNSNQSISLNFTVTDSEDAYTLPKFEKTISNPTMGATEYYTNKLTFKVKFDSEKYGSALAIWKNGDIKAYRFVEKTVSNTDITTVQPVEIGNTTSSFANGEIEINIPCTNLSEKEEIKVVIPENLLINKSGVSNNTSLEQLYKDGACTNAETAISFSAKRVSKGDVNGDGTIDVTDVTALVNTILGTSRKTNVSDVNNDNNVDVSDVTELVNIILSK